MRRGSFSEAGWGGRKKGLRTLSPFCLRFAYLAADAADTVFLAMLALRCFFTACFLTACFFGVAVVVAVAAGTVTAAGVAVAGALGAAGAWANEAAATEDSSTVAKRVLRLVMMNFQKGSSRVCSDHLEQAQCHSGLFP